MARLTVLIVCLLSTYLLNAQIHPLSRSDSGVVIKNLEKYERLKRENDYRGASEALNDVAFLYWNNNHYAQAASYYELSLSLNKRVGNENGIAMINNNLGMLYFDLGRYNESLQKFTETLAARRSEKKTEGIISALINLSTVHNSLGSYNKSIEYLTEALDLAREKYDEEQMRSVYGMLAETYEKKGDVEKSLEYFEFYRTFHQRVQEEQIQTVNKELEAERLERQRLLAEKAQKENELLKQKLQLYEKDEQLLTKDSINESLNSSLTRAELQGKVLEQEKELAETKAQNQELENERLQEQKAQLRIILIITVIAVIVIVTLIWIGQQRTKKHNDKLAAINESLERQTKELEIANHTKDRMFSVISHDLRSPITSLQGFFMAIDEFEIPDDLKGALANVESQLSNSATLLDNLLVWSRSQLETEEPAIQEFKLSELVDHNLRLLQHMATSKDVELVNSVGPKETIKSDPQMVSIVVRNLMQNAIKFTPRGGKVSVGLAHNGQASYVKVADTGVGMSSDKMNSLFDITTNKTTDGTEKEKGSGLGLILCKELIEKVGGEIAVTSEEGAGTEFSLKFYN
ncbi:ATP-binding protein [Marinoscillum sp.]|uniref:ATP-binding protein n=1 Tax=Marinoscillum sp. TaxID=2024838 RepID=UPI003BAC5E0C